MPIYTLTKVNIGKESTWGTAVAATYVLPVTSDPAYAEEYNSIRDSGRRGLPSMDYALLQGGGSTAITLEGNAAPTSIGFLLHGIMGTDTLSGASDPYTHTIKAAASVPSYTIEDDNPVVYREYPGAQVSELRLAFTAADGLLTYSSGLRGKLGVTGGAATPTTSLSVELDKPYVGIDATVSIGGTVQARVTSFEISLARAQEAVHVTGSRDPIRIDPQPLEASFQIALDAGPSNVDDVLKYTQFLETPLVMTCEYGTPASAGYKLLTFTATKANFGDGVYSRDLGGGMYQVTLNGRCIHNTTDAGPCVFVVQNARSTAY